MDMKTVRSQSEFENLLKQCCRDFIIDGFTATLRENSTATLWGNSTATLWDFSVVYKKSLSSKAQVISPLAHSIQIDYPKDIVLWCCLKGIEIKDRRIFLWKSARNDGTDFHTGTIQYNTDREIVCPDWEDNYASECGAGLHLADSPDAARIFVPCGDKMARLFQVSALIEDCVCWPGQPEYPMKLRAKKCLRVKEYPIDYRMATKPLTEVKT